MRVRIPEPLMWGLFASGLCIVLMVLALAFVWWAMGAGDDDQPYVWPPTVQPGPPVER